MKLADFVDHIITESTGGRVVHLKLIIDKLLGNMTGMGSTIYNTGRDGNQEKL